MKTIVKIIAIFLFISIVLQLDFNNLSWTINRKVYISTILGALPLLAIFFNSKIMIKN